jgi:hypothetical protein
MKAEKTAEQLSRAPGLLKNPLVITNGFFLHII